MKFLGASFDRSIVCGHLLGLFLLGDARALPLDQTVSQLYHTQWTVRDGAPAGIENLTQTQDGYIWIAAAEGLFRFDGVKFERIDRVGDSPLPAKNIFAMWAPPEGGLWIGYRYGGASFIAGDRLVNYFMREGLPPHTINAFARDRSGVLWAGATTGMMRLEGGTWMRADQAWGMSPTHTLVNDLRVDGDGTLWVLADNALFFLRHGSRRFDKLLSLRREDLSPSLVSSPDGGVWLGQAQLGLKRLQVPQVERSAPIRTRMRRFDWSDGLQASVMDRDWNLWLATTEGVTRWPLSHPAHPETGQPSGGSRERVGLTGGYELRLLEDREGNIWIGTNGGLDKFRSSAFVKVAMPENRSALAAGDEGTVWVGTWSGDLHRFVDGIEREVVRGPMNSIQCLYRDTAGTLWVGDDNSLWRRQSQKWIEWRRPGVREAAGGIQAMASDDDAMWVSIVRGGVYRVANNHWTLWGGRPELPTEPATTLVRDANGRLWFGYVDGRIAVLDRGRIARYAASDGLLTGTVQAIWGRGRNVWVGGQQGLSRFDGHRFRMVKATSRHSFASVNGIVETAAGDLWLNTSEGAVHIAAEDVRKVVLAPDYVVRFRLLNYLAGMPGAPNAIRPLPSLAASTDGRLWFTSTNGIMWIDPRRLKSNTVVPNVYVKALTADGNRYVVGTGAAPILQLPPRSRDLQIAYTALSLAAPERVNFKYRLEGANMGWQDVGTRREAYFTALAPGSYRFQVVASNDAGVWNRAGATVAFVIPPTFLQSRWFVALCVALASGMLWLLFIFRMRQIESRLQWRHEERLLERERIARELHDTFLQGVQGLMLRFQTATERIPAGEPAKLLMEDALDRADRVLAEGRDKVSGIRGPVGLNLAQALQMAGEELARDHATAFDAEVEGAQCALNPVVHEEAYRIGAETLANAFRHARATHVSLLTQFGRGSFVVRITDDGSGFDVSTAAKPGHWGLKGMRERTARVGGRIAISSQPGAGTTIELHVPARLAYARAGRKRWHWLSRLIGARMRDAT
ncbi:MAG: two-component regulator propeller domain-containing protein [Steroidobacteraceae bacterium]